jgi:hypothetical protein
MCRRAGFAAAAMACRIAPSCASCSFAVGDRAARLSLRAAACGMAPSPIAALDTCAIWACAVMASVQPSTQAKLWPRRQVCGERAGVNMVSAAASGELVQVQAAQVTHHMLVE